MANKRHQRLAEIVHAALDMSGQERGSFIRAQCGDDRDLRAEAESMLRAASDAGDFLNDPLVAGEVVAGPLTTPGGLTAAPRPGDPAPGDAIGPFILLRELGRGGFGTVWLAERREPMVKRVALKVISPGMDSRSVIARFGQERQALALMNHPNIASVFDGGMTQQGRPYFVMEFVDGEPLTEYCDRHGLGTRQRLELFLPVCDAVQHAHHKGIIHRDLKPRNVLVTEVDGRAIPKVIDFGISKATDHRRIARMGLSLEGQLIGTLEYMGPEQACGLPDVDTRADVYSLGMMLYELLVGRLPFQPDRLRTLSLDEARRIIREEDPPRPSTLLGRPESKDKPAPRRGNDRASLHRELRKELDWVPLKAIRKDRERRYASPRELADDIQRFLDGRPLRAAPESRTYLLRKLVARHRGAVAATLVIAAALTVTAWAFGRAQTAFDASVREHARAELDRYHAALSDAQFALDANDVVTARAHLEQAPARLRGWEWNYLRAATDDSVRVLRVDPGAKAYCLALSPDGSHAAAGLSNGVVLEWPWKLASNPRRLAGHHDAVTSVAFSPDGRRLLAASQDATVRTWDAASGDALGPPIRTAGPLREGRFGPDGGRVLAARQDRTGLVRNPDQNRVVSQFEPPGGHTGRILRTRSSPSGLLAATASDDGSVGIWSPLDQRLAVTLPGRGRVGPESLVAIDPDGRRVAQAWDRHIRLWSPLSILTPGPRDEHDSAISGLAFSPDGTRLVSASLDGTARVWNTADMTVAQVLRGHDGSVVAAGFSPQGDYLLTASHDATLGVWDARDGRPVARLRGHEDRLAHMELSGDGAWAMTSDLTESLRIWDLRAATAATAFSVQDGNPTAAAFSRDGLRVAVPAAGESGRTGTVAIWSTRSMAKQFELHGHTGDVWSATFDRGGSRLVTASQDGSARIWDLPTKQCLVLRHDDWVNWASFSPDDARVVTASGDRSARVWDADNGREILRLEHPDQVRCAAYSPTAPRIATACDDGGVYVWDADRGDLVRTLPGHDGMVTHLTYSPSGGRIAASYESGVARVWDAATGQPVTTLVGHTKRVMSVNFSPDETRLVTASWDQSVRVWDPASGRELAAFRDHHRDASWAAFSPDGTLLLTTYQGGTVLLRDSVPRAARHTPTIQQTGDDTH